MSSGQAPLVLYFGHTSPGENPHLFRLLVERLAATLDRRLDQPGWEHARASGVVVNTCGWVDGVGYELLLHAARALGVTTVFVLGHDRLASDLTRDLRGSVTTTGLAQSPVAVVKLARSGGAVQRPKRYRAEARARAVQEYFYGRKVPAPLPKYGGGGGGAGGGPAMALEFSPSSTVVSFNEVEILCVGGEGMGATDSHMLPVGQEAISSPTTLVTVTPSNARVCHCVMAVSHAQERKDVLEASVAGVVYVSSVDENNGTMTLLTPCPCHEGLPGRFLLVGSLKWTE